MSEGYLQDDAVQVSAPSRVVEPAVKAFCGEVGKDSLLAVQEVSAHVEKLQLPLLLSFFCSEESKQGGMGFADAQAVEAGRSSSPGGAASDVFHVAFPAEFLHQLMDGDEAQTRRLGDFRAGELAAFLRQSAYLLHVVPG